MGLLAAERIKLASTRSPWWSAAIIVVLSVGFAAMIAAAFRVGADPAGEAQAEAIGTLDVATAMAGVGSFGLMVVMIMAALTITTEYRFGTIRTSFLAAPGRSGLLAAKSAVVSVLAVVVVAVAAALSYLVARAIAGSGPRIRLDLDATAWRQLYGLVLVTPLLVVFAMAVGVLLRQTAGVIALVVLWPQVIEPLFTLMGEVGREIYVWMPFANMNLFLGSGASASPQDFHWGPWGGLIYFAVFTAIVAGAGLYVVHRRDA